MNSYLEPLVTELKELWKGVIMPAANGTLVFVRAALICTKVSGFVGHNAYRACSKYHFQQKNLERSQTTVELTVLIKLTLSLQKSIKIQQRSKNQ